MKINIFSSSLKLIVHFNNVILLSSSLNESKFYLRILKEFLEVRGLSTLGDISVVSLVSEGFDFLSWNISKEKKCFIHVKVNSKNVRKYKSKLKAIIKSSFTKDILSLVKDLNREIKEWTSLHFFSDDWKDLAVELDIYIYKILWRHVRRCHPRRTNTWIYSKYWKQFSGTWRFFYFDLTRNKLFFLKSHISVSTYLSRISSSLNTFNLYNHRKVLDFFVGRGFLPFSSGFNFLYKKQKGLCTICRKPLYFRNSKLVKSFAINNSSNDIFRNFKLIHNYCKNSN